MSYYFKECNIVDDILRITKEELNSYNKLISRWQNGRIIRV